MRTIKFRAWNVYAKEWIDEDFSVSNDGKFLGIGVDEAYDIPSEFIIMQSIGLFDKTGKEIYEGDIVKGTGEVFKTSAKSGPSEVFYGHGQWQPFAYVGVFDGTQFEVIGNIYEHEHLLK